MEYEVFYNGHKKVLDIQNFRESMNGFIAFDGVDGTTLLVIPKDSLVYIEKVGEDAIDESG